MKNGPFRHWLNISIINRYPSMIPNRHRPPTHLSHYLIPFHYPRPRWLSAPRLLVLLLLLRLLILSRCGLGTLLQITLPEYRRLRVRWRLFAVAWGCLHLGFCTKLMHKLSGVPEESYRLVRE